MSSYLIYALATHHLWPGLPSIEDYDENMRVYEIYPHLQLHRRFEEYIKVNDAFTLRLCQELQGCHERRFSPKAISVVGHFKCCFIQFPSFFYLRIGAFDGFPKILPKYPIDKIVLVKLCRQILEVNTL